MSDPTPVGTEALDDDGNGTTGTGAKTELSRRSSIGVFGASGLFALVGVGIGAAETPDASEIQITVTDPNGDPVEGVAISGDGEEHPADIPTKFGGETDENGVYTNVIYENDYEITASHPYYVDETVDHTHDSDARVDVELAFGVSELTVAVVDSSGDGIDGASVEGSGEEHPSDIPTEFGGDTDENGVYTNVIFQNDYEITVDHEEYHSWTDEHAHYDDSQIDVELEVAEPDAAEIVIEIVDSSGSGIEGISIEGRGEEHPSGIPTAFGGETDENGVYTNVIYENDYEITATHPHYGDETTAHAHYGDTRVEMTLEAEQPDASDIHVTVTDTSDEPVEGVSIQGDGEDHPSDIPTQFDGETDGSGVYTNYIFENDYEITASHPHYVDETIQHAHYGDTEATIVIESSVGDGDYYTPLDSEDDILDTRGNPEIVPNPNGPGDVFGVFYEELPDGDVTGDDFRGNNQRWRTPEFIGWRPEQLHVRFYLYFPENWEFHSHPVSGGSKHGGPASTHLGDCGAGGTQCWDGEAFSTRMCSARPESTHDGTTRDDEIPLYWQIYTQKSAEAGKDHGWHHTWDIGIPNRGEWAQIDHYVELNDPGLDNGVLMAWVDEELAYERDDYRFRGDGYDFGVNAMRMHNYFGGGWGSPKDQWVYWKDLTMWADQGSQL